MPTTIFAFITIIVILGALAYLLLDPKKKQDSWKELADSLGMSYEPQNIRKGMLSAVVSGNYRGRDLKLNTIRSGSEAQALYTQIQLQVDNPDGKTISISKRNIFTEAVKRLGVPYVSTGDEEFDRKFVVVAKPQELVKKLLGSPYLRQKLIRTRKLDIDLRDNQLKFLVRGFVRDTETILELFDLINEFADRVEKLTLPATSFSLN